MTFQGLYCELLLLPSSLNLEQTSTNLVLSNPRLLLLICIQIYLKLAVKNKTAVEEQIILLLCIASSTSVYMFSSWLSSSFSCCSMMLFCSPVTLLAVSFMILMMLFSASLSGLMGLTPSELSSLFISCQTSPVCNGTEFKC